LKSGRRLKVESHWAEIFVLIVIPTSEPESKGFCVEDCVTGLPDYLVLNWGVAEKVTWLPLVAPD